jgi:hypothetical protein
MTYNDINGIPPITSNATSVKKVNDNVPTISTNFPTLLYNVNLNRGSYRAKIVGIKIASSFPQGADDVQFYCANPTLFGISSSCFRFPLSADNVFWFSGNGQYSLGNITGNKEFIINNPVGQIDLSLHAISFGALDASRQALPPYIQEDTYWDDMLFVYLLLTIDVEPTDLP